MNWIPLEEDLSPLSILNSYTIEHWNKTFPTIQNLVFIEQRRRAPFGQRQVMVTHVLLCSDWSLVRISIPWDRAHPRSILPVGTNLSNPKTTYGTSPRNIYTFRRYGEGLCNNNYKLAKCSFFFYAILLMPLQKVLNFLIFKSELVFLLFLLLKTSRCGMYDRVLKDVRLFNNISTIQLWSYCTTEILSGFDCIFNFMGLEFILCCISVDCILQDC